MNYVDELLGGILFLAIGGLLYWTRRRSAQQALVVWGLREGARVPIERVYALVGAAIAFLAVANIVYVVVRVVETVNQR